MQLRPGIVVPEAALAAVSRRHHVLRLSVFGSSARGDFRPDSDFDVLVDFEPGARVSLFDLADLRSDLADLIGVPVDLVTRGGLKPLIRERILSEARSLYAA